MMTAYEFTIQETEDGEFLASEEDGFCAAVTGYYKTLEEAQQAVLKFSKRVDLDWESGRDEDGVNWWSTGWDVTE